MLLIMLLRVWNSSPDLLFSWGMVVIFDPICEECAVFAYFKRPVIQSCKMDHIANESQVEYKTNDN